MSRYKQILNTCSPLERVIKFNNAVTQGVTNLQLRLKSTPNNNNTSNNADQSATTSSGICKKPPCRTALQKALEKCHTPAEIPGPSTSAESPVGCMPFQSNVPIKPKQPKLPREPGQCRRSDRKIKAPKTPCSKRRNC